MTEYEEIINNHDVKNRLDHDIKTLTEIRDDICSLGSYTLHAKLSIIVQDLQEVIKTLELESKGDKIEETQNIS